MDYQSKIAINIIELRN